jgi:hypothetical protein
MQIAAFQIREPRSAASELRSLWFQAAQSAR